MYGEHETSRLPRLTAASLHAAAIAIAAWVLWAWPAGGTLLGLRAADTPAARRAAVLAAAVVYFARVLGTMFVFLRRRMAWSEALTIGIWVLLIHTGFALLARTTARPLGALDAVAAVLYVAGSYFNTGGELERMRWKAEPAHAGKLYTEGLFGLSRHINYFGDTLLFTGYALLTTRALALVVPVLMVALFVGVNIPMLDRYLAGKYGEQYVRWARRTKRFVPFVY